MCIRDRPGASPDGRGRVRDTARPLRPGARPPGTMAHAQDAVAQRASGTIDRRSPTTGCPAARMRYLFGAYGVHAGRLRAHKNPTHNQMKLHSHALAAATALIEGRNAAFIEIDPSGVARDRQRVSATASTTSRRLMRPAATPASKRRAGAQVEGCCALRPRGGRVRVARGAGEVSRRALRVRGAGGAAWLRWGRGGFRR